MRRSRTGRSSMRALDRPHSVISAGDIVHRFRHPWRKRIDVPSRNYGGSPSKTPDIAATHGAAMMRDPAWTRGGGIHAANRDKNVSGSSRTPSLLPRRSTAARVLRRVENNDWMRNLGYSGLTSSD